MRTNEQVVGQVQYGRTTFGVCLIPRISAYASLSSDLAQKMIALIERNRTPLYPGGRTQERLILSLLKHRALQAAIKEATSIQVP